MTRARDVANLIGSGNYSSTTFTATAGQTAFTISHTQGFVQVFMNGLLLDETVDYTSNGSAVTLTSGAAAGDEIEVVAYNTFSVGDALNQAAADTRYVNVTGDTMTGTLKIGSATSSRALATKSSSVTVGNFESTSTSGGLVSFSDANTTDDVHVRVGAVANNLVLQAGGSERARLSNSGDLLVGKTSTNFGTEGIELRADKTLWVTRSGSTTAYLNRTSSDGEILQFTKNGSASGKISIISNGMYVSAPNNGGAGLLFNDNANPLYPAKNNSGTMAVVDDYVDLGASALRFDDVYATNGTIQTSDENEKQNIASLTSAEITAATAISKLFKTFKWKSKVTTKGNDARIHTGVIAQQVEKAMSDAGLDASKYAFWCSNTWWQVDDGLPYDTKDEAPEGATKRTRMGVRYPELLAFIGAATEQRLTNIETRLATLEGG